MEELWLTGILGILVMVLLWKIRALQSRVRDLAFSSRSLSVKYGKMSEQFFPFLKHYPYDAQEFRFLGSPVDGVQFEKDRIVFVEFKSGESRLSTKQQRIKELVEKKKVSFKEVRVDGREKV